MKPTGNSQKTSQQPGPTSASITPQPTQPISSTQAANMEPFHAQNNKKSILRKIIKLVIAAVICVWIFAGLALPVAIGHLDTHAPTLWVTIVPAVIALSLFAWLAYRVIKKG